MIVEGPTIETLKPVVVEASPRPAIFSLALRRAQGMLAQRALKSDLSKLVSMAKDHEANGLAAGHEYYRVLYKLACEKAEDYAGLRGIKTQQLYAELASIEVLRKLAEPAPASRHAALGLVGIPLLLFGVGIACGLVVIGFHLALHIFGVH